jgi:DNA-binding transcriptional ArsR family regulator
LAEQEVADSLAALGHEARLRLFRLLVRAGPEGLTVGEIGRHPGLPASTLAHHLRALVGAGLVAQARRGRETVNRAEFAALRAVLALVESECCAGVDRAADDAA